MAARCCRGLPRQRVEHLASGVAAGLQGLYGGFAAGLVGIVRTPMQSYSSGQSILSGDLLQSAAGTAPLCDLDHCQLLHRSRHVVPQNRQNWLGACIAQTADEVIMQQALNKPCIAAGLQALARGCWELLACPSVVPLTCWGLSARDWQPLQAWASSPPSCEMRANQVRHPLERDGACH